MTLVRLGTGRIHSTLSWKITVDSLVSLWTKVNNPAASSLLPLRPSTGWLCKAFLAYFKLSLLSSWGTSAKWTANEFPTKKRLFLLVVHTRLSIAQYHNVPPMGVASQYSSRERNNSPNLHSSSIHHYYMLRKKQHWFKTLNFLSKTLFYNSPFLLSLK